MRCKQATFYHLQCHAHRRIGRHEGDAELPFCSLLLGRTIYLDRNVLVGVGPKIALARVCPTAATSSPFTIASTPQDPTKGSELDHSPCFLPRRSRKAFVASNKNGIRMSEFPSVQIFIRHFDIESDIASPGGFGILA